MSLPEHLEDFCFEGNQDLTPCFRFDVLNEELNVEGNLSTFHSHSFYQPVWNWLGKFLMKPQRNIQVNIELNNLTIIEPNVWHFLSELNQYHVLRGTVKVNWYYPQDKTTVSNVVIDYLSDFEMPFELTAQ